MLRLSCNQVFYSPNDIGGPSGSGSMDLNSGELSKDDIYDALNDDGEPDETIHLDPKGQKPEKNEEKTPTIRAKGKVDEATDTGTTDDESEEQSDELDELAELEEEIKEPEPEQLELTTPVRRKEILSKYPNLFKDFPYLEKAYYREQQFTEIYPTIDDAKLASDKATAFDGYVGELFRGDTANLLKVIKSENENSFHSIVDNYLTSLYQADQQAYYHVVGNVNKMTIAHMVQEGKKSGNDEIVEAARVLHQFIFGNREWTPPTRLAKEQNGEAQNVNNERQQFIRDRYLSTQSDLQTRLDNIITSTIDQNIDRTNAMTSYVKKAACQDAMSTLQRLINNDSRFQQLQVKLWEAAFKEGFSKPSVDRIKSAFTTRAKTLLPSVLKKARNDALKGMGRRVRDDSEDINDGSTRTQTGPKDTRRTTSSSSQNSGRAKQIPKNMTTLEFLNQD